MPKINYNLEMERELARLKKEGRRPLLALHSCCAPCSSAVLERLHEAFQLMVFYYNPNISPEAEFRHRAQEQKRLAEEIYKARDYTILEVEHPEGEYTKGKDGFTEFHMKEGAAVDWVLEHLYSRE